LLQQVILRNNISGLKDSKKLTKKKREELSLIIMQNSYFSFGSSSPKEIDKINILQASLLAMKRAILNLSVKPGKILIDGIHKPDLNTDTQTIISGDSYIDQISAASIIAKVYRDNLMMQFDKEYPNFYFSSHMGYGTKMHKAAIKKYGITPIHRKTFKGVAS
jgi:ribonuclease HII